MLSLLKNSFLRRSILFRSAFFFADSSSQHIERNKAILASQIIQTIKDSPLNEYRSESPCPSLRQKILDQIETYKMDTNHDEPEQQRVTSAVRYALRKYFVDGVWVPYDMCGQPRFSEESISYRVIKNLNEEVEIRVDEENEKNFSKLKFRKLRFCPTYFVTGQIFRQVFKGSDFLLLTGQYGVGKTYSFILYTLLSEIIFRYRYKYHPNKLMTELPSGILSEIPKAFYWSVVKKSEYHDPIIFNNLIKRHFYELKNTDYSENILDTIAEKSIGTLLVDHFEIRTILLMDQISQLASALRQCDLAQQKEKNKPSNQKTKKKSKSKKTDEQKEQQKKERLAKRQIQKDQIKYLSYKEILREIIQKQHFNRIIYLSSVDIERHLLNRLQLMGPTNQAKIEDFTERISYPTKLYGDVSVSDTVEFFVFLLKTRWIQEQGRDLDEEEQKLLNQIRNKVYENVRKQLFVFFLPLSMKRIIGQKLDYTIKLSKWKQEIDKLDKKVFDLMKLIQDDSVLEMQTKLTEFLLKKLPDQQLENIKPILLIQLWAQSFIVEEEVQKLGNRINSQNQKAKSQQIMTTLPDLQIGLKLTNILVTQQMVPAMPHKLFGFKGKKIVCFVNPIILHRVIRSQRQNLYHAVLASNQEIFKYFVDSQSATGIFIQSVFIDALSKGNTSFEYFTNKKLNQKVALDNIFGKVAGFFPIPKINSQQHKKFYFLKSFVSNVTDLLKNQNTQKQSRVYRWNLLLPMKREAQKDRSQILQRGMLDKDQFQGRSKLIDFAICIYGTNQDLQIYAFDVTTGKDEPLKKIDGFLKEFANFQDKYANKITINGREIKVKLEYTVITTKKFEINYEDHFKQKIPLLKKHIISQSQGQAPEVVASKLKVLDEVRFQNFENVCNISREKPSGSNEEFILKSIGVVSMFHDVILSNSDEKKIDLQMRLIERIKNQFNPVWGFGS